MSSERISRPIAFAASRLTAGRNDTNMLAVLLLASRGRNVYPRNVNDVLMSRAGPASLQYTMRVLSGCSSRPTCASRAAIASRTWRAWPLAAQCTTTSSQYRSNGRSGTPGPSTRRTRSA